MKERKNIINYVAWLGGRGRFMFQQFRLQSHTFISWITCDCGFVCKGCEYLGKKQLEYINDLFWMFTSFTCVNTDTPKITRKTLPEIRHNSNIRDFILVFSHFSWIWILQVFRDTNWVLFRWFKFVISCIGVHWFLILMNLFNWWDYLIRSDNVRYLK